MKAIILICGFMAVGFLLERINGKKGFLDEFLTPLPLCLLGCFVAWAKGWGTL